MRNGLPRANAWALRRTVSESRKRITRGLSQEIAVPQKKLYQRGSRRRPVHERLERRGSVVVGGRVTIDKGRLPLGRFSPKQHWKKGRKQGRVRSRVTYKILKAGGRKKVTDAFLVEMKSGYEGIFRREGKGRYPLYELHGPSVPQVAEKNAAVQRVLRTEAAEIYLKNVSTRTQYLLERV